jgi:shikimate kinase
MRGQVFSGFLAGAGQNMKIILIGYRASGKSTIGLLLSEKLKIPFVDTDCLIEEAAGMPVKKLIELKGWEEFRKRETEALASLQERGVCVVATGGGAIIANANRLLLKKSGVLVYLKTPFPDILARLKRDALKERIRPQFTSENLAAETLSVLSERIPLYESAADFTVDTQDKSVIRVTEDIYQHLLDAGIVFEIKQLKKTLKKY